MSVGVAWLILLGLIGAGVLVLRKVGPPGGDREAEASCGKDCCGGSAPVADRS